MATTDQELKTLNKTVTDALNILKLYVGSTAQMKKMNEKEKDAIEKLLKVAEQEEENQKRQRAFTERARDANGRFIKKREGMWGKMLDMTEATFSVLNKMSFGVLGKVKNMVVGIAQHFSRFFSELKSQFLSLFGEESEWFALLGALKDGIKNSWAWIKSFVFQKTPKWASTQIKILRKMLAMQMKEWKMGFLNRKVTGKEMGVAALLGIILAALLKGLAGWLGDRLSTLMGLGGLAAMTGKFDKLGTALRTLRKSKWLKWVDEIPGFTKGMKILRFGMRRILLPIAILMDVLDFMEAYQNTEGTKWDKTREGLWAAMDDWIELPLQVFLHITNGIMKLFGEEMNVQAKVDEMMRAMKSGWDFLLKGEFIEPLINFGIQIRNLFARLINNITEKLARGAELLGQNDFAANIRGMKMDMKYLQYESKDKSVSQMGNAAGLRAAEMARGIDVANVKQRMATHGTAFENVQEAKKLGEALKKQSDANTALARGTKAVANFLGFGGGGQGDIKQVPDETDYLMLGFGAHTGATD